MKLDDWFNLFFYLVGDTDLNLLKLDLVDLIRLLILEFLIIVFLSTYLFKLNVLFDESFLWLIVSELLSLCDYFLSKF